MGSAFVTNRSMPERENPKDFLGRAQPSNRTRPAQLPPDGQGNKLPRPDGCFSERSEVKIHGSKNFLGVAGLALFLCYKFDPEISPRRCLSRAPAVHWYPYVVFPKTPPVCGGSKRGLHRCRTDRRRRRTPPGGSFTARTSCRSDDDGGSRELASPVGRRRRDRNAKPVVADRRGCRPRPVSHRQESGRRVHGG